MPPPWPRRTCHGPAPEGARCGSEAKGAAYRLSARVEHNRITRDRAVPGGPIWGNESVRMKYQYRSFKVATRTGGATFISPALQRWEHVRNRATQSRRDAAETRPHRSNLCARTLACFGYFCTSWYACTQAFIRSSSVTPGSILQLANESSFRPHRATTSPLAL